MKTYYKRTRVLMGTALELTICGDEQICAESAEAVFQEVSRIEDLFTIYRPDSPISRLNATYQPGHPYQLDQEIITILNHAFDYASISGGAFDPTSGPAIALWGFGPQGQINTPPSQEEILKLGSSVNYQKVQIDAEAGHIIFFQEKMSLNLGGIVKGYAIDRAIEVLKHHGITSALVSFGSTLYALGRPPKKAGWRIGIRHPRQKEGEIESALLVDMALATSGDYERCFDDGGHRFSHLIDPYSARPVRGMASVSLIATSAMAADALSTAAFVLGKDKGCNFLESQKNIEGLLLSEGPKGQLEETMTSDWQSFSAEKNIARRRFLAMSGIAIAALVLPAWVQAASIRFTTAKEALARMMPDAQRIDTEKIHLSAEQHDKAQEQLGKGFRKKDYTFFIGWQEEQAEAYAVKLNVVGKKRPITFLIGINPEGKVIGVEVLVYRESKGSEVRYGRFMKQFFGKTKSDSLRLGDDVRPISGATLSSRSSAYAVKKALSLFEVLYGKGKVN